MNDKILKRQNHFGIYLKDYLDFNNISINDFAERIGTTPKNLIDILEGRITISQNMIYNIAFITDISVAFIENLESSLILDKKINEFIEKKKISLKQYINLFHYKELPDKYSIKYNDERNEYSIAESILKFLRISDPNLIYKEDNTILYKSKCDKPELLALWLERCYRLTLEQTVKEYKKENIDYLVEFIRKEASNNQLNEKRIIKEFNDNGIFLVIENDLSGSKIRGAFRVLNTKPAIYITKKHKRYADIYFALLHELAHCKTDYNRAKKASIVSLFDYNSDSDYEIKANETALNWMIPEKEYEQLKNNYNHNPKGIIKSFLAYRLAKDGIISYSSKYYQDNNPLIKEER